MKFLYYMAHCWMAWRRTRGVSYFGLAYQGVPQLAVIIAKDRDAWIVTQLAIEHQLTRAGFERDAS